MTAALFWSGGKDSLLALDIALSEGRNVTHLVNIAEGNTGRVRFHGVPRDLVQAQADALGIELVQGFTHPQSFEEAFLSTLESLRAARVEAIVFGNIHLEDIREWYESRVRAHGFEHVEPLWKRPARELLETFVDRGHRARIVSVYAKAGGRSEWLGREFDPAFVAELLATAGTDPCGERGEYHSFAFGGPLFAEPLDIVAGERFTRDEHLIEDIAARPAG